MRTTVTLDPDTEHLIREEVRRSGHSFKRTLNEAIKRGLQASPSEYIRVEPLFRSPFPTSLGNVSLNRLADELDDEETLRELGR